MKTFNQHITEAFDKPYKYTLRKKGSDEYTSKVKLPDGSTLEIQMSGIEWDDDLTSWNVSFTRGDSMDVTGAGDQMRIFATVIDALKQLIKKESPEEIRFSAAKTKGATGKQQGSREKLYGRLVKRFAGQMGYKATEVNDGFDTTFYLEKK